VKAKAPYKKYPIGAYPHAPVLNVQIARRDKNSPRSKRFEAFIDSGASRCIFHTDIGKAIGLDVDKGKTEDTIGVSGQKSTLYLHDINLHTPAGVVAITAGFSADLPCAGLLGMEGFFQHFKVIFEPAMKHCEIERFHTAGRAIAPDAGNVNAAPFDFLIAPAI
jgi:hypothetical protein